VTVTLEVTVTFFESERRYNLSGTVAYGQQQGASKAIEWDSYKERNRVVKTGGC
jgi:hypothetical protein